MRIALVLGGGGGKGGYSAGVCCALQRNGITPDVVSGISVGALNGVMVATAQYQEMEEVWHTVTDDDVRKERTFKYALKKTLHFIGVAKPYMGFWSSEPLQSLVREMIIGKHVVCDFYCGAVEVDTDTFTYFHIPKGTKFTEENVDRYVKMVVASTAIPGIFEPIEIDGKLYVDGGVHHQMPLEPVSKEADPSIDYIIGVSHKHRGFSGNKVRDDIQMIIWTISSLLNKTSDYDFDLFELINDRVRDGRPEWKGKDRVYYPSKIFRPMRSLSPSTRFHHEFGKVDFKHGEMMAKRFKLPAKKKKRPVS